MIQFFVDVDGVLSCFDKSFVPIVNKMYNKNLPPDFVPNDWLWTLDPVNLKEEQSMAAYHEFLRQRGFRHQAPYMENVEFLRKIHEKCEVQIDLVTNIPEDHREDRVENLKENGVPF